MHPENKRDFEAQIPFMHSGLSTGQMAAILDNLGDMVEVSDADSRIQYINPAHERNYGYKPQEVLGKNPSEVFNSGTHSADHYEEILKTAIHRGSWSGEMTSRRKDGTFIYQEAVITVLRNEMGEIQNVVAIKRDITDQRRTTGDLERSREELLKLNSALQVQALSDELTGLNNRRGFLMLAEKQRQLAYRNKTNFLVIFADLNRLKSINDGFGHEAGDEAIRVAADCFRNVFRDSDIIARIGGDEFTIVAINSGHQHITLIAERLTDAFHRFNSTQKLPYAVNVSIGFAVYDPAHNQPIELLMSEADHRLYANKAGGPVAIMAGFENELRQALQKDQFILEYQPVADAEGKLVKLEALLRWQSEKKGVVSPLMFIPMLEDTKQIIGVGYWQIEAVCNFIEETGAKVTINLSTDQFHDGDLPNRVKDILDNTGIDPSLLGFEIKEASLMSAADSCRRTLKQFAALGVSVTLDDFGNGYSSLKRLKEFPISELKVHRSFIDKIAESEADLALTVGIIELAKGLGKQLTAKGVETGEQRDLLAAKGCNSFQGFLYARPLSADGVKTEWLIG